MALHLVLCPIVGELSPLECVDGASSGALPIVGELGPLEHVDHTLPIVGELGPRVC